METQQTNGGLFTVFVLVLFAFVAFFATGCTGPSGATGQQGKTIVGPPGRDGADGEDGQDCFTEIIDPCGDGPGVDEIVIRMCTQQNIAWYLGIGLVQIGAGNWVTTDQQACVFHIDATGNISW